MGDTPAQPTIVHINSCRYSGSTWLNLMLGAHRRMFSVGELDASLKGGCDTCVVHGAGCPVWGGYRVERGAVDFSQIARLSGSDILVLNNAPFACKEAMDTGLVVRQIILLRDGRAVTASEIRKNPGLSMRRAARRWASRVKELLRVAPERDRLLIHYESLQENTTGQLDKLCAWLGVEYDPGMLDYALSARCFMGGNLGTHMAAARNTGDLPAETYQSYRERDDRKWDLEYYRGKDPARFRDDRWVREFSFTRKLTFAWWAGGVNRRIGY